MAERPLLCAGGAASAQQRTSIIGAQPGVLRSDPPEAQASTAPSPPETEPPVREPGNNPVVRTATPAWARRLARDWCYRPLTKIAGICAFTWLFFIVYFQLLRAPSRPVTVMPLTPLDALIPFQPGAVWAYVSLWIYIGIAPALLPTLGAGLRYAAWAAALCGSGLLCFWLWPTMVPASLHAVDVPSSAQAGFALLRGIDAAGNACPSLHVASAVFSAMWIARVLGAAGAPRILQHFSFAWLLAIVWSTLAIRQHVVLDVVAGAVLGLAFGLLSPRWASPLQSSRAKPPAIIPT